MGCGAKSSVGLGMMQPRPTHAPLAQRRGRLAEGQRQEERIDLWLRLGKRVGHRKELCAM